MFNVIKKIFKGLLGIFKRFFYSNNNREYSDLNYIVVVSPTTYQLLYKTLPKEIKFEILDKLTLNDLLSYRQFCKGAKADADMYMQSLLPMNELNLYNLIPPKQINATLYLSYISARTKLQKRVTSEKKLAKEAIDNNKPEILYLLMKKKFSEKIVTEIYLKKESASSRFRKGEWRWSPLIYYAAFVGSKDMLILLLRMGANIHEEIIIEYNSHVFERIDINPVMSVNYSTFQTNSFDYLVNQSEPILRQVGEPLVKYTNFKIIEKISEVTHPECRSILWIAYAEDALKKNNVPEAIAYFKESFNAHRKNFYLYLQNIQNLQKGYQHVYTEAHILTINKTLEAGTVHERDTEEKNPFFTV